MPMTKKCDLCNSEPNALFRCSYGKSKTWKFLCQLCLEKIKSSFEETYRYGGTWKRKNKTKS